MKLLVALDDAKLAEELMRSITAQFSPASTEIHLLHVLQPISVSTPPQMARSFIPELEGEKKRAQELLDTVARRIAQVGFKVESSMEQGDPREAIIDAAMQRHTDLIIIGSRGGGDVSRFFLGSVAESVIRHAPYSVQVVRIQR